MLRIYQDIPEEFMRNFGNVPRKFPGIDFEEFFSVNSQEFPPNLVRSQTPKAKVGDGVRGLDLASSRQGGGQHNYIGSR